MKNVKVRKIIYALIIIIAIIRIAYIVIAGDVNTGNVMNDNIVSSDLILEQDENITIEFTGINKRLESMEIDYEYTGEITDGEVEINVFSGEKSIYCTRINITKLLSNTAQKIYVNIPITIGNVYNLTISTNGEYREGIVIKEIRNVYSIPPSVFDKFVLSLHWIVLCGLAGVALRKDLFSKVYNISNRIWSSLYDNAFLFMIFEAVTLYIWCECGRIELDKSTEIVMLVLSLLGVLICTQKRAASSAMEDNSLTSTSAIIIFSLYAAFSVVGSKLFIFPLNRKIVFSDFLVYSMCVLWFLPIVEMGMHVLEGIKRRVFCNNPPGKWNSKASVRFFLISLGLVLVPTLVSLIAFNPGITALDTYICMIVNGKHLYQMADWHPAFYCMILRAIMEVWDSTYAIILVQYFFFAYVVMNMLLYARKKRIKDEVLYVIAFLIGINSSTVILVNTILKDIPYTMSVVLVFVDIVKLVTDEEDYKRKWFIYCELIVGMVGIFLYRQNGVAAYAVIFIVLAYVFRKNARVWIALGTSVLMIFLIKGPVYSYFDVQDVGHSGMYIGLGQDILGAYYNGGDISESTMEMVNVMAEHKLSEYHYNPAMSNQSSDLDVSIGTFITNYIDTFVHNPVLVVKAVMARIDMMWNVYSQDEFKFLETAYAGTIDGGFDWNEFYPARVETVLYDRIMPIINYAYNVHWIEALQWRCGIPFLVGVICAFAIAIKHKVVKMLAVFAPILGQVISLVLSTGWTDFRYYWSIAIMGYLMILVYIVFDSKNNEKDVELEA